MARWISPELIYHYQTMKSTPYTRNRSITPSSGVSLLELLIVCAVTLILAGIIAPEFLRISYNIRLKDAASNISALVQQARILAARQNTTYTMAYTTGSNHTADSACIDLNLNGTCDSGEPLITFSSTIHLATAAPDGTSGQPSAYVLVGDTGNTVYTNGTTLGYSSRGLPCSYSAGACPTPAGGYFVYYLTDARPDGSTGWAALVVTRAGRGKVVTWNGASWN